MTQPPFPGNDFFDQIDSVARNLTGNAYRLKRDDPTAPQKFTEFIAQSEQEFNATQPQAAPQSFRGFEQDGFQINPAGDRRAGILAQQQAQADAAGPSVFDQTLGRGVGAFGRAHLEAFEDLAPVFDFGGGVGAMARQVLPVRETPFDRAFAEKLAAEQAAATNPFERVISSVPRAFRESLPAASDMTILGSPAGASNPIEGLARILRGERDYVTGEGLWDLNRAELGAALLDPLNVLPVVGAPGLVTKPARAAVSGTRAAASGTKAGAGAALRKASDISPVGVADAFADPEDLAAAARAAGDVEPMRVFHGSEKVFDISDIESAAPRYPGGLGEGVYVAPDAETAGFYGRNVQETELRLKNPLKIDPENFDTYREPPELVDAIQRGEVDSVLIGEAMQPFDVRIGGKWHQVRDAESLEDIGALAREAGHDGVIATRLRGMDEILVLDKSALGTPTTAPRQADAAARGAGGVVDVGDDWIPRSLEELKMSERSDEELLRIYGDISAANGDKEIRQAIQRELIGKRSSLRKKAPGIDQEDLDAPGPTVNSLEGTPNIQIRDQLNQARADAFARRRGRDAAKADAAARQTAARGAGGQRGFKVTDEAARPFPEEAVRFTVSNEGSTAQAIILLPDENGKVIGSIVDFETSPELRRQGFGEALVRDTTEELRRRGATSFEVYAEKTGRGPELFSKLGFKETGRTTRDAREMVLDLTGTADKPVVSTELDEAVRVLGANEKLSPEQLKLLSDSGMYNMDRIRNAQLTAKAPTTPARQAATAAGEVAEEVTPLQRVAPTDPLAVARAAELDEARRVSAAGGRLTPEQQAIIDATPVRADLPSDVTGGKPPTARIDETVPAEIDPDSGFRELRPIQENLDVAFNETMNAKLGRIIQSTQIGRVLTGFNPMLGANNEGKRAIIGFAHSLEEGTLEADRLIARIDEIGSREGLFGDIDDSGLFMGGEFKGLSLNEVREKAKLPAFRARMTPDQQEYIDVLGELDEAASAFMRKHGQDIGFTQDEDILFASRRIKGKWQFENDSFYGAYDANGELITTRIDPDRPRVLGTQSRAQQARSVRTAAELREQGFVLMPYDEVVKLRIRQSYRIAAEDNLVKWVKENYEFEKSPTKKNYIEAQKRLFDGQVATTAEGEQFLDDLVGRGGALENFSKAMPANKATKTFGLINNFGRTFVLAGDASLFTIQLLAAIFEDFLPLSARGGLRHIRPKVPGRMTVPTVKQFATSFARGMLSPENARKANARTIVEASEEGLLDEAKDIIMLSGDNPSEFTESVGTLRNVNVYLRRKGGIRKVAGKVATIYTRPLEAFQEAFIAAMNMAGLQLWRALRPLTKNADGTVNPQKLADVEDFINNTRGLTSSARMGVSGQRRWIEGNSMLAARYRRATAALMTSVISGGARGDLARNQLAALITGMTLTMAAFTVARGEQEGKSKKQVNYELKERLIPGNGTYMMADEMGQKVGFGSKFISDLNFITKIQTQPSSMWDANIDNNVWIRWLRSQFSFALGEPIDLLLGRDVVGNVTRPGDPVLIKGDAPSVREGVLGLTKSLAGIGIPVWAQSVAFEGGDIKQRQLRGGFEFVGSRAYEQGRSSVLTKASFDKFGKPLEDLNQLERFELQNDPQLAPVLEEFDNTRASTGDKFASYRVQRLEDERVAYNRKSADLETMIEALANIKTYGETWSVLNTFADNIGEVKGTLATKLERTRKLLKLEGYVGEEPKNDFDRMLNKWYELFDVHTSTVPHPAGGEAKHRLVFETWIPASEAFIASYSPDLQEQLQQWRDRKQEPLGIDAILETRRPNEELYGLDDEGNAKRANGEELFNAVQRVLMELGWTEADFYALRESE